MYGMKIRICAQRILNQTKAFGFSLKRKIQLPTFGKYVIQFAKTFHLTDPLDKKSIGQTSSLAYFELVFFRA